MNRRTLLSAAAAAILAAGSFSASAAPLKELKIAATPVPQGEVLKFVKPILAKEGIDLKIIEFTDYIAPNAALDAKEVDVNFYQHQPFLDNAVRQRHINAVRVAPIYILPMAVYSQKLKSLKKEAKVQESALEDKTREAIEALTDEQVYELFEAKWVTPLMGDLNALPQASIDRLIKKVNALEEKYKDTYADVAEQIGEAEKEFDAMLGQLVGDEFDMLGIAELRKLLGGE